MLASLLLNMVNKITGNLLKTKLGTFSDEQGTTSVESLLKRVTAHDHLRTTGLDVCNFVTGIIVNIILLPCSTSDNIRLLH